MRLLLFSLVLGLNFSTVWAGNGTSGGGNIYGDQLNPWFLQNTPTVSYCVEIDPDFSDLPRSRVLEVVGESIEFWKKTFREYRGINFSQDSFEFDVKLGTQSFQYKDTCDGKEDLKFQMGFLTQEQQVLLPNHRQLLGIAYRTSYDSAQLRGKGFIYVAPERGPSRPVKPLMHPRPWSHGLNRPLLFTLQHELGHIFGLQDDHYGSVGLMDAKLVERVTERSNVRDMNKVNAIISSYPFGCNMKLESHGAYSFLTSESEKGKWVLVEVLSRNGRIQIMHDKKLWGEIELSFDRAVSTNDVSAISVYLTRAQRVFRNLPREAYNQHLEIYHNSEYELRDQQLKLVSGEVKKFNMEFDRNCTALGFPDV